ncbi:YbdD/YjiX family protein [Bifidobacterium simiarum]|uniref:DUF466 domain-containing protein n=2 Tax=Bifidobacterium simiarum TaxID=2045441 RepID=A0A2M9HHP6_9BIFI|nr:YbdD/YjiX family protein [Bifidobacterium simiarum]PJM76344.1 hypothetical protein CSQ87_00985 [Bifidobacterium simiarum]
MGRVRHAAEEIGEAWGRFREFWRDLTGENAYDRYVERHRRQHPDHEPMSEREFWRARDDFHETHQSTGCC